MYYIGHTNNLIDRLLRHNSGRENFTSKYMPWSVIWATSKDNKALAYQLELKLL